LQQFKEKRKQKKSLQSGKNYRRHFCWRNKEIFYSVAKLTFTIFSAPHIAIIAFANCTTSAVVAFGVLMARMSVAWVVFCEDVGQRINFMLLYLQIGLCDLHKWCKICRTFHSIYLFSDLEKSFHRFSSCVRHCKHLRESLCKARNKI